jgi:hypothetical protein
MRTDGMETELRSFLTMATDEGDLSGTCFSRLISRESPVPNGQEAEEAPHSMCTDRNKSPTPFRHRTPAVQLITTYFTELSQASQQCRYYTADWNSLSISYTLIVHNIPETHCKQTFRTLHGPVFMPCAIFFVGRQTF